MTLRSAPLAVDGGYIDAAMVRLGTFTSTGGAEGIVGKSSLKVSSNGTLVTVAPGSALVLNRYQTTPSETYSVTDVGGTTLAAGDIPANNASARSHLLCVTIGDPEFPQSGHPWMLSTDPAAGMEEEFSYVRYFIIQNVSSSTTTFEQLNLHFPAYALARVDVPANTAFAAGTFVDVRQLARPRTYEKIEHLVATAEDSLNGALNVPGDWEAWPDGCFVDITVPSWAVRAKLTGFVEGAKLTKAGEGKLRLAMEVVGGATIAGTTVTNVNESAPAGTDRRSYNVGGEFAIPAGDRGQVRRFRVQGTPLNAASQGFLKTDGKTSAQVRVLLVEEAE